MGSLGRDSLYQKTLKSIFCRNLQVEAPKSIKEDS